MNYVLALSGFSQSLSISLTQMLLGVLITWLFWIIYKEGDFSIFKSRFFAIFLLLYLSVGLTILFADITPEAKKSIKQFWVLAYLFCAMFFVTDRERLTIVMTSIIAGGLSAALLFISQFAVPNMSDVAGFLSHTETFKNSIVLIAILCFFAIFETKTKKSLKIFYICSFPLLLTVLFLAGSFLIVGVFIVATTIVMSFKFKKKNNFIIFGLIVLFVSGATFIITSKSNPNFISNEQNIWQTSAKIIADNPIFGIGNGNYKFYAEKYNSSANNHNSFSYQGVTNGLTGLVILLIFLGAIFQELTKAVKRNIPYSYGTLGAFIAFILCGLTENNMGDSEVAMLMWLMAGSVLGIMFNGDSA